MKIKDVMNKVIAIEPHLTLKEAAQIMSKKNIGSLVVVDNKKLVGIITDHDIIENISNVNAKVSDIMSKNVVTVDAEESIDTAAEIMKSKKVRRLPVVEEGKLVGIITATDIIAHSDELNEEFLIE